MYFLLMDVKVFLLFTVSVVMNIKEEESIEMLKILGLLNNIKEYQKIYNHV